MKTILCAIVIMGLSGLASASDRILVSVPPLFSLTSILLEGVDKPSLLFETEEVMTSSFLSEKAIKQIRNADMLIWAGPQFESNIATYALRNPAFNTKNLTITETIPTFTTQKKGDQFLFDNPHDMRFWLDPRLTTQAIARISTKMITLYPDSFERILENEEKLRKMIMQMEKSMRANLQSADGVPIEMPDSDILYLAWRYNLKVPKCPSAAKKIDGYQFEFGLDHYFEMMISLLKDLKRCQEIPEHQM